MKHFTINLMSAVAFFLGTHSTIMAQATYCAAPHTPVCNTTDMIKNVKIIGTCMNNNVSTCNGNTRYWDFTQGASYATLHKNSGLNTYTLSVTTGANNVIGVWIDYNHDTVFSASEWTLVCSTSVANNPNTVTLVIDTNALTGDTRMRIRSRASGSTNNSGSACTTFGSGNTHDYRITIDSISGACSGQPSAGTVGASADTVCAASAFSLCLSGGTNATGLTYQWQISYDNVNWSDISGATSIGLSASQTLASYYRCIVTCSGSSDTSASKFVDVKLCFCASNATSALQSDIGRFHFGHIDNGIDTTPITGNTTATQLYTDYSGISWNSFVKGQTYDITITQITAAATFTTGYAAFFIDYNHDGNFQANERVFGQATRTVLAGGTGHNTIHAMAAIPVWAKSGPARLRVVLRQSGIAANTLPCGTYTYGETEDYTINIDPIPGKNMYVSRLVGPVTSTNCSTQMTQPIVMETTNNGADSIDFSKDTLWLNGSVRFGASTINLNPYEVNSGMLAPGFTRIDTIVSNYTFNVGLNRIACVSAMRADTFAYDDTLRQNVTLVSYIPVSAGSSYLEDFENGNGGWVSGGTGSSWAFGNPAKNTIKGTASGVNCWVTGGLGTGLYTASERSFVMGPCFDLSQMDSTKAEVSLDIWWNSENNQDGAALQYSIDGGTTWVAIGTFGDPNNWYTSATFNTAAVGTFLGGKGYWTGRNSTNNGSKQWVHAVHSLPGACITADTKFRIAFGSSTGTQDEGFAFDNFQVREAPQHDLAVSAMLNPGQPACLLKDQFMVVQVMNTGKDTIDFATDTLAVDVLVAGPNTNSFHEIISTGVLYPNTTLSLPITGTVDMSTPGTYTFYVSGKMLNDQYVNNDSTSFARTTLVPQPLTYWETFNTAANIPTSYTSKNWARNATNGKNGTASLRTATFTNNGLAYSPSVGQLTKLSVLKFSYKVSATMKSTDSIAVQFSGDCGQTWETVYTLDTNTTQATAAYYDITVDVSKYAGGYGVVALRNYNNSTTSMAIDVDDIIVADKPDVNLGPDTAVCGPLLLNCNPNQQTWTIYWHNGNTDDTVTVFTSGQYYVYVIDQISGLDNSDTINVSIYTPPVVNLGADQTVCPGTSVTFDAGVQQAGNTYNWSTGASTQTISTSSPGTYICSVMTPGNCGTSDTVELINKARPTGVNLQQHAASGGTANAGTAGNPDAICVGDTFAYEMTPPSGYSNADYGTKWAFTAAPVFATQAGNSPSAGTVTIVQPGAANGSLWFSPGTAEQDSVYWLVASITDLITGCDTTVMRALKVNTLPTPSLGADNTVCPGTTVILDAGSFSAYLWSTGATTQTISVSAPATYSVTVTDANGCKASDDLNLGNYAYATVSLGADKAVCPGQSVTLDAGTASAYTWSTGATTQTISVNTAGSYHVEIADANGCKAGDTVNVTIAPVPVATFTSTLSSSWNNYTFNPTDPNLSTYAWDFGDGGQSTLKTPSHIFLAAQSYTVWLKTTNTSGCSDSSSQTVNVVNGISQVQAGLMQATVFPNPFQGQSTLTLQLGKAAVVSLNLYDMTGRKLNTLLSGQAAAGSRQVVVDTRQYAAAGVYTLELVVNGYSQTFRLVDLGR